MRPLTNMEETIDRQEQQELQSEDPQKHQQETPLEGFASICSVLVIGLFALTFIFQNFVIPSGSMEQTLLVGDHVVVDRENLAPATRWAPFLHYRNVRRGDIIVFFKPGELIYLVKRVVGVPGDRIHLNHGTVYLNGEPQVEPQTTKVGDDGNPQDAYNSVRDDFPANGTPGTAEWSVDLPNHIQGQDIVVPPGEYFAMGDNRPDSMDSRYWGFVPRENIVGRPMFVYWSFITPDDELERTGFGERVSFFLHEAVHFFDQTRWKRTLHMVR